MKTEKKCTGCQIVLPIYNFSVTNKGTTHRGRCKKCVVKCAQNYRKSLSEEKLKKLKEREREYKSKKYIENKEVIKEKALEYRIKNREKARINTREWRRDNPDKDKKSKQDWNDKNKEKIAQARSSYRQNNIETLRAYGKEYYKKNYQKYLYHVAKRRAKCLNCIPKWGIDLTKFVYGEAAKLVRQRSELTGLKWHIDHIIPLQGKNVTGLHVWNNFQVIPALENLRKKNNFNGDDIEQQFIPTLEARDSKGNLKQPA